MLPEKKTVNVYKNNNNIGINIEYCTPLKSEQALFMDKYAERVFDALTTKKHGVLITGGRGVGKTTLVKYVQYLISNYKCPKSFFGAKIYEMSQLALGYCIKSIAEYEERINEMFGNIIDSSNSGHNVILFIDSINSFVSDNNINAMTSMHLEHAIKRSIPIICCCGTNEKKSIDSKYDLFRHFTEIKIKEPVIDDVKTIVKEKSEELAKTYHTVVTPDMTDKVVMLSDKYVKNGFCMPKKAISILENTIVRHANNIRTSDSSLSKKIDKISVLKKEHETCLANTKDGGDLNDLLDKIKELQNLETFVNEHTNTITQEDLALTDDDIYTVISDVAGVPVAKLTESDTSKLKNMIPALSAKVIGQDETISKVCKTVKRNRLGLRKKNHTIGNFIFIGSTGVGKTFFAKKLAEYMFGSEESLIRLDMSEYADEISVNKLIGAPPGYVGYGEGGVLCNAIKNNPYSVVLFDEIEKAHKDVFNILLQILDDGRITDGQGRTVDFKNTIIIMTSNLGSEYILEKKENANELVMNDLQMTFKPEFINRIDEIIIFHSLSKEVVTHILDKIIHEIEVRLHDKRIKISLTEEAKNLIIDSAYDENFGARPIKRFVQRNIESLIANAILQDKIQYNSTITIDACDGKFLLK